MRDIGFVPDLYASHERKNTPRGYGGDYYCQLRACISRCPSKCITHMLITGRDCVRLPFLFHVGIVLTRRLGVEQSRVSSVSS
jgi:hypothetical protein